MIVAVKLIRTAMGLFEREEGFAIVSWCQRGSNTTSETHVKACSLTCLSSKRTAGSELQFESRGGSNASNDRVSSKVTEEKTSEVM